MVHMNSMVGKATSSLLAASNRACSHPPKNWLAKHSRQRKVASTALQDGVNTLSTPKAPKIKYRIQAAVLLNRSPILTRTPTSFEAAHYEYNAHIARALHNPFPVEFYFKAGSVLEKKFMREEMERERAAFGWKNVNSTLETNQSEDKESSGVGMGALSKEEKVTIMPRITEADRKGDVKSLNRKGDQNIYLLVKKCNGRDEWRLPGGVSEVREGELLHEAAQRELNTECGLNMDTWIVGRHPIAFMDDPLPLGLPLSTEFAGSKTFFFKAHILAGQVTPSAGSLSDFAWLTRREIKRAVTPEYWTNIRDILSDF